VAELDVCPVEELPPCSVKIVYAGALALGVYNLNGEYYAIEDRCSHDDGPLAEGEFDCDEGVAIVEPVQTYPVHVRDGWIKVQVV
jgi:3-phenylpropionate/trans-cinnamate dioxygenase ferredoxin subunit